jgi:hypothetical protein
MLFRLTNCDLANTSKEYNQLINLNKQAWKSHGILVERVIPISALAELKTEESEICIARLNSLNGGDTGFKSLKEIVNKCVYNYRYCIAKDRCNDIKIQIREFSSKLNQYLKKDYNLDSSSKIKESLNENEMEKIHNEWW